MSRQQSGFLVLDLHGGAADGWYRDERMARAALADIARQYPGRSWMLMELIEAIPGRPGIPARCIPLQTPAIEDSSRG